LIVADSGRISALSPRPAFEITSRQAAIGLLIGGERRFDRPTFRNNMLGKTRNHITDLATLSIDARIHDALNLTLCKRYGVQAGFINQTRKISCT